MHRLTIIVLFSAFTVGIASISVVMSKNSSAAIKPPIEEEITTANPQDSSGAINGLSNPELIPDRAAYLILFRLLANRNTSEEKKRVESYIRDMLDIGCESCGALRESGKLLNTENANRNREQEQADIDAVFAVMEEFNQQVALLDNQAKDARERRRSDPQAILQLTALQAQKNTLIESKSVALIQRLSSVSRSKLQSFINGRLKQKIKIVPIQPAPATQQR